jgi:hypothetical protein
MVAVLVAFALMVVTAPSVVAAEADQNPTPGEDLTAPENHDVKTCQEYEFEGGTIIDRCVYIYYTLPIENTCLLLPTAGVSVTNDNPDSYISTPCAYDEDADGEYCVSANGGIPLPFSELLGQKEFGPTVEQCFE